MADFLESMRSLWTSNDKEALKHRVGYKQFAPEIIKWYEDKIFKFGGYTGKPGFTALEYGCGVGRLVKPFARKMAGLWFGVDISPDMIRFAKEDAPPNTQFIVCDGAGVPGIGTPVDFIYSVITLQHISSYSVLQKIYHSFRTALMPGGKFAIQVKQNRPELRPWNYEPRPGEAPEILRNFKSLPPQFHFEEGNSYNPDEIRTMLTLAGLTVNTIVKTETIDDHGEWLWVYGEKPWPKPISAASGNR
jgi:SAM-dependent methyltransferase